MKNSPTATDPTHAAALAAAEQAMATALWEGREKRFHQAFQGYLKAWKAADPDGRQLLEKLLQRPYRTGFQSLSTDRAVIDAEHRKRWDLWLAVLPLDLQLGFLVTELDPRLLHVVDFPALRWDQRATLARDVSRSVQQVATALAAWKEWDRLADWMDASGLRADTPLESPVYVHYRTPSSRGSTAATLTHPLPFWAVGLYTGATEPGFWDAMARPDSPPGAPASESSASSAAFLVALAGLLRDPLAVLEPMAPLDPEATDQVARTAAAWRSRALDAALASSAPDPRRAPRM